MEVTLRRHKKDQVIVQALRTTRFAYDVLNAIAQAVTAKGGTFQHILRIVKEPAIQRQIADLIVPTGSEAKPPLSEYEYLVPVSYDMPCDKEKLESEFSKDGVSELFYGNYELWQPHSSCTEIDQTPGNRVMLVVYFGRNTKSEANIAEMDKLGYRPATHLEAYAFAKANPELQRQFWIVALGSSAMCGVSPSVAVLDSDSGRRILDDGWFNDEWDSNGRFLFVRK